MTEAIITSLIGIIPTIIVAITSIVSNNQIVKVKLEELEKQVNIKIDNLDKKVQKHNEVIERTYKLESDMKTAFSKFDENRDRIERLENREMGK